MARKSLDLNLLPIAVALYDELSVSRTARRLGMSQPGVSRALRRLREVFDDPLFVRRPNGIMPTPRAHALVRAARPHVEYLQDDLVKDETFDPAVSTRPITLAISDVAELTFFPMVIEHFRRLAPKCPVQTVSLSGTILANEIESGHVDVAAGAAEHIVVRPENRSQEVLERFIQRRRIRRNAVVYTSHVLSVPSIVMESDLMATLPYAVATRFAQLTPGLAAALPPFDISYDLKLHWHRRFDNAFAGWLPAWRAAHVDPWPGRPSHLDAAARARGTDR